MTLTERIILSALLCLMILAAAISYDPPDRYQYDQAEISYEVNSFGK